MSVYKPNLDKYTSVYFVAPLDNYELEVIKPSFKKIEVTDKDTNQKVAKPIVSFLLRIVSGENTGDEFADKPVTTDFWLDSDNGWNSALKFLAACKGVQTGTEEGDETFRAMAGSMDLSVNDETGDLGAGFHSVKEARVRCTLSQNPAKNDPNKMYQKFGMFLPF